MRAVWCIIAGVHSRLALASGPRRSSSLCGTLLAVLILLALSSQAIHAQAAPALAGQTTLVVFSDRPLPEDQWIVLFANLRSGLTSGDPETRPLDSEAQFVRGDRLESGIAVDSAITVFLHGDCSLAPLNHRTAYGVPLGWVRRVHGRIEPFVHVDCSEIGQVLGGQMRWYSKQARSQAMAEAMARVILHEWIHIATQSPHHAGSGVAKAQFGVSDLLDDDRGPALSGSGR